LGKLLIVDDDDIVRCTLVAYLEDSGFDIIEAADGGKALQLYQQEEPDVVICDLRMPEIDGMQVLREIEQDSRQTPVIVVSGAGVMSDVVEALRLGAADYFIKPVADMELLEFSVRRCMEQVRLRKENQRYRQKLEQANIDLKTHLSVLEQDQQAGRYVQLKMFPETPKQLGPYEFSHHIFPSLYLSGDFVEYVTVGSEFVTFFIADVSGHGASSAFVTVLLKNLAARLRSSFIHKGDRTILSPAQLLMTANREMLALELGKHVTMFVGTINLKNEELTYSVAGHLPLPILFDGQSAQYLAGRGRPVGLFADTEYEEYALILPETFSLTLFSDGVLEILPPNSLQEKEDYLLSLYQNKVLSLDESVEVLRLSEVDEAPDDIAVMTLIRANQC
jgi:serine phosphatase RsbU (regulator of sigma subunit)